MDDELPTRPLNPPPEAESGTDDIWLVSYSDDDDREMTPKQISDALGRGEIDPGTIVWRDGMADWQPISELQHLKEQLKQFAQAAQQLRKKRTVLGGFAADVSKLPVQPKPTGRLGKPASPVAAQAPAPPMARDQRDSRPSVPARPGSSLPAGPSRRPSVPPPGPLDRAAKKRTLLGTGAFKVPTPGAAGKLPSPRGAQSPLPPVPSATHAGRGEELDTELDSAILEPVEAFEAVEPQATAIPLNRAAASDTPTVPLPGVRPRLDTLPGPGERDDDEDEPPTLRPFTQAAASPPPPRRPHSPRRPSRPPPAHHPSEPPPASEDAEPISLIPESIEALSSDDLESVVANLPPPEAPSAPAIFDVDLSRNSTLDIDVSSAPRAPERAGDSILTGPSDINPPSIDLFAPGADLSSPRAPSLSDDEDEATATPPLALPTASDAEGEDADDLLESGPQPPIEALRKAPPPPPVKAPAAKETAKKDDAKPALPQDRLPPPPPKKSRIGTYAIAALALGGLFAAVFYAGRQTADEVPTDEVAGQAPEPTQAEPVAPAAVEPEPEPTPEPEPEATGEPEAEAEPEPEKEPAAEQPAAVAAASPRSDRPWENKQSVATPSEPEPQPEPEKPAEPEPEKAAEPEKPKPMGPKIEGDPASVSAGPAGPFDTGAAAAALGRAAGRASACRKPGDPSGVAQVSVTFSNSGRATRAIVNGPPFAGTATGGCIAGAMRGARVPKFTGERVTVRKKVVIN